MLTWHEFWKKVSSSPLSWCFFERLDYLIGPVVLKKSTGAVKSPLKIQTLNPTGSVSSGSSLDDDDDDDVGGDWGFEMRKQRIVEDVDRIEGEGSSCRELARAILKLGEVYERIESAKQEMMIELEKQSMEVSKELELQRMNILMDMQMELEKSKLRKRKAASGYLLLILFLKIVEKQEAMVGSERAVIILNAYVTLHQSGISRIRLL
ncbi:unnamed protein product [Eruca vesicaria subsp. sativa]|uniref:Uncharacterized protein n=1 Tax=Eruca vesicaria subsp. sativa TaxID=29727 RepID=A0ABC8IXP9_ERUVS|nr:unnamed protein product [Eruca vesicaria subsp. sativa]